MLVTLLRGLTLMGFRKKQRCDAAAQRAYLDQELTTHTQTNDRV